MKALNLFSFTRIDADYASEYMNMLSARETREKCRPHEFMTVKRLTEVLLEQGVPVEQMDGFFFSYSIHQISKEFDLLKIETDRMVLNIELKSAAVSLEEIEKQLRQNRYYLSFVAPDIRLFTFVAETGAFYQLIGDRIYPVSCEALTDALSVFREYRTEAIEELFEPKQFLISPFTDPSRFLQGKYFLTQQQQEIRERILELADGETERNSETVTAEQHTSLKPDHQSEAADHKPAGRKIFGITGGTGSGKTLLLYELARSIARRGHSCLVIHSGTLSEGHEYLREHWEHVDLRSVDDYLENSGSDKGNDIGKVRSEVDGKDGSECSEVNGNGGTVPSEVNKDTESIGSSAGENRCEYIFVDEAHRMQPEDVKRILFETETTASMVVFSYDDEQWLSPYELKLNIPKYLREQDGFIEWTLSRRIRTGLEISAFYRNMLDLNNAPRGEMDYSHIDILYAAEEEEAEKIIELYTGSLGYYCPERQAAVCTGPEYDQVLMIVDQQFFYDSDGCLSKKQDLFEVGTWSEKTAAGQRETEKRQENAEKRKAKAEEEQAFSSRMYRHITRTRDRLCILVVGSYSVFRQIAGIKYRMLERVKYKDSTLVSPGSGKQLNRFSKAVKEAAEKLPEQERLLIIDTVDILQEQLTRFEGSRKILQNGIRMLRHLKEEYAQIEELEQVLTEYLEFVQSMLPC